MSNELTSTENNQLSIWDDEKQYQEIKKMYGSNLSEGEFMLFVQTGKALNLNPFLRQIWAVKYGSNSAQIFVGRDGYLVNAMRHSQYAGMESNTYYSNDIMKRNPDGTIHHESNFNNRGKLIGAYAIVYRRDLDFPIIKDVLLSEYNTGKSNWAKMPATMIKKVAEAQALRFAFPEVLQGTWHESEQWENNQSKPARKTSSVKIGDLKPKQPKPEPAEEVEYEEISDTPETRERVLKGISAIKGIYEKLDEEEQAGFAFKCNDAINQEFPDENTDIEII